MDALEALHSRSSVPRLSEPLPSPQMLENIYKAAFRAADHAVLRPWRFLLIKGDSRIRLGDLFVDAGLANDASLGSNAQEKLRRKPKSLHQFYSVLKRHWRVSKKIVKMIVLVAQL